MLTDFSDSESVVNPRRRYSRTAGLIFNADRVTTSPAEPAEARTC
jgi:hypothetical protein